VALKPKRRFQNVNAKRQNVRFKYTKVENNFQPVERTFSWGYVFELQDSLLQLETYPLLRQGIGLRFTGLIVPAGIVSPAAAGDMFLNRRIICFSWKHIPC
jgi:hypothetical protein